MTFLIDLPAGRGPAPLVIVSPGAGGTAKAYAYLGAALARDGFVVFRLTQADGDEAHRQQLAEAADPWATLDALSGDPVVWRDRPQDISFLLDCLNDLSKRVPELQGRLRLDRIGLVGHSLGAYTALALAGAHNRFPDGTEGNFGDRRVTCFIAMSPQGPGVLGYAADSWRDVDRPVMIMTGSLDRAPDRHGGTYGPAWRLIPFLRMPPGDKYAVWLAEAGHLTFADRGLFREDLKPWITRAASLFMKGYLQGDAPARVELRANRLKEASGGLASVTSR
jgi:pimeloyl-ACP methyl ester carboxylesterase